MRSESEGLCVGGRGVGMLCCVREVVVGRIVVATGWDVATYLPRSRGIGR